ncbi:MAG: helix-turn-helix domain-containing protein [Promicromonosporaceae bacterium]|nr:helix-turn-helix domain-containing protein [Promicromonosporaceae bacterium]
MTEDTLDPGVHAALASPVRLRVLDVLRAADDAPTAQTLAAELGLHVTTVRFHLDLLEEAGLVARETRRAARRGRPAVHYALVDDAPTPGPGVDEAREEMIGALAEALASPDAARPDAARAAGRRWAERLPAPVTDARSAVADVFARLGFGPEPDGEDLALHTCPFRSAAQAHPQVVCQVHLGLAEGLAARARDGGAVQVGLRPFVEPDLCVVRLHSAGAGIVAG